MERKKVAVIGMGRIGGAFARILKKKGHLVEGWDKNAKKVRSQKKLEEVVSEADFVFLCVPSNALREVLQKIQKKVQKKTILVCLAKGIETKSLKIPEQILGEFDCGMGYAILGGPLLAEELLKKQGGVGLVGSSKKKIFLELKKILKGTGVSLVYSRDTYGVSLGGVLKNIYSLAFGIASALSWGGNMKGWFFVQALREMSGIAKALGGNGKIATDIGVLGDVAACSLSPHSHNRKAGEVLLKKGRGKLKTEGIISAPSLFKALGGRVREFPILFALQKILEKKSSPQEAYEKLVRDIES